MTAHRVDRRRERLHAALQGKPAPDVELEAAHQFQRTTNRIAAPIAREIVVPEKTVQDWGNVNSGDRGPHLTLLYITQLALEMRPLPRDRAECFAALDFVERLLGRVAYELPVAAGAEDSAACRARKIANGLTQFAEFIDAVDEWPLDRTNRARAYRELGELQSALSALLERGIV